MNKQLTTLFFIVLVLIFIYVDFVSLQISSVTHSDDANKTCHEGLTGSQSIGNIEFKKDGCTLLCTILSSSTSDYSGYYDISEERIILRSNTFCRDSEHVSTIQGLKRMILMHAHR